VGPHRGHIRATNNRIAADNPGHHRPAICPAQPAPSPPTAGRRDSPSLARTEEVRGSNPLTSTPQSPAHRPGGSHPPGRCRSRFPFRAANGQQPRTKRPTATRLRPRDGAKRTRTRPSDYESAGSRPPGAGMYSPCSSRRVGRPASALLTGRVCWDGMTERMTAVAPKSLGDELLAWQSDGHLSTGDRGKEGGALSMTTIRACPGPPGVRIPRTGGGRVRTRCPSDRP
jgi:hypothetical protein